MSQVSNRQLSTQTQSQINQIFLDSFALHTSTRTTADFLTDLLSPTEQLMLAKRLAIAYMLTKGYSQRTIADIIKVSQSTVNKVNANLQSGTGYHQVIAQILKKESIVAFFDKLESTLDKILPPPKGSNWSARSKRLQPTSVNKKAF